MFYPFCKLVFKSQVFFLDGSDTKTATEEKMGRACLALISSIILATIYQVNGERTVNHFTPVPLMDVNKGNQ